MAPPENNDVLIDGKKYHAWKGEQYIGIVHYSINNGHNELFILTKDNIEFGKARFVIIPDKWQMIVSSF
jgi:hypothetical protein